MSPSTSNDFQASPRLPSQQVANQDLKLLRDRCDWSKYLLRSRSSKRSVSPPPPGGPPRQDICSGLSASSLSASADFCDVASTSSNEGSGSSKGFHSTCKASIEGLPAKPALNQPNISMSKEHSEKTKTFKHAELGSNKLNNRMEGLSNRKDRAQKLVSSFGASGSLSTKCAFEGFLCVDSLRFNGTTGFGLKAGCGTAPTALHRET
mmetsp:Transcript_23441/g.43175  ORF Transcript_23441/g.43175 Transcript_23441/m.43175 type:complete len:207 (+) Transcript_23441:1070-1690(+)